jgi:hypothetical protein
LRTQHLIDELTEARQQLFDALDRVSPASMTTPGLVGDWSGRELIAHVGYWAGNAVEVIHAVEEGRAHEVGEDRPPTDEVNETVARIARETDLATVRKREAASAEALVERLRRLDGSLLDVLLPDGTTLERSIAEDGAEHYREHANGLRRALTDGARE